MVDNLFQRIENNTQSRIRYFIISLKIQIQNSTSIIF